VRRHRIRAAAFLTALALVFAPIQAAQAATIWGAGYTSQGFNCSWLVIHISSDNGLPGMWTKGTTDRSVNDWCSDQTFRTWPGTLRVAQDLWAWGRPAGEPVPRWFRCNRGPWSTNNVITHEWTTGFAWPAQPCGSNWFYGVGFTEILWGGRWHGGGVAIDTVQGGQWIWIP
jgi:hypothetical protein